jgi:D-alanine-D-alanine ligase
MKVAVVRNRNFKGVINRFGQPCPEKYGEKTVQRVVDALSENGHTVALLEADKNLLSELERFMPPGADGMPTGMVFNMAYGIQGECRYTHVPAMLEMAGVPYTGSSPLGHSLALDKIITKTLIQKVGVPTPDFRVMSKAGESADGLRFPLVVKPRHESTSYGLHLVNNPEELDAAVAFVVEKYEQDALVEEYIDGRELCVALLGNDDMEFLPLVESDFGDRKSRLITWADKFHKSAAEPEKICPVQIDERLAERLREISLATFRACHCKDYSRVDIRVDSQGNPFVLEINSMASLGGTSSYVLAAETAGYTFASMINRILDVAHRRYFGAPALRYTLASDPTSAMATGHSMSMAY